MRRPTSPTSPSSITIDLPRQGGNRPIQVCTGARGWLKGWREVGLYCGFGGEKGTAAARVGRAWEKKYSLPVHRMPNDSIRAIPFELDQWLIAFDEVRREAEGRPKLAGSKTFHDWRAGSAGGQDGTG